MRHIAVSGSAGTGTTTLTKKLLKELPGRTSVGGGTIMRGLAAAADRSLDMFNISK